MALHRASLVILVAGGLLAGCSGQREVGALAPEECSLVTLAETGRYCPERIVVDRSNLYCYRTLADVDCHHLPDPYKNGHVSLASPPPDLKPLEKTGGAVD
jgi:hypothetical protein